MFKKFVDKIFGAVVDAPRTKIHRVIWQNKEEFLKLRAQCRAGEGMFAYMSDSSRFQMGVVMDASGGASSGMAEVVA